MPTSSEPPQSSARVGPDVHHEGRILAGMLLLIALANAPALLKSQPAQVVPKDAGRLWIDPNAATIDELMLLPGIGPALSSRIVSFREASDARPAFVSPHDLEAVRRIGPATARALRPFLAFPEVQRDPAHPFSASP